MPARICRFKRYGRTMSLSRNDYKRLGIKQPCAVNGGWEIRFPEIQAFLMIRDSNFSMAISIRYMRITTTLNFYGETRRRKCCVMSFRELAALTAGSKAVGRQSVLTIATTWLSKKRFSLLSVVMTHRSFSIWRLLFLMPITKVLGGLAMARKFRIMGFIQTRIGSSRTKDRLR